ncbi:hypothetical protein IE81DRAFT_67371 [Ceraceosorus guamensis]|uniref:Uncharacterized protein n=1 Tax=Ceraceosorus guamensis TaxID=1522189 RepID=A0A316W3P4_9BASI|nr:hypothetical protein IE81DRAFT_67371 [Ceraceosorus guamensis]PWN43738.1 hypothetical protein IE81DRAFT_67371 [Ceraceosorus guamensis]
MSSKIGETPSAAISAATVSGSLEHGLDSLKAIQKQYRRWEPLPKILFGFCVLPFSPELESVDVGLLQQSSRAETQEALATIQSHLIGLEIGDEVYIFEQLGHADVAWFRGYVVSSNRVPQPAASNSSRSEYSAFPGSQAGKSGVAVIEEPQVYVGLFPSTHIHIREQLDDAELRLAEVHALAVEQGIVGATAPPHGGKSSTSHMETVHEEDEGSSSAPGTPTPASVAAPKSTPDTRDSDTFVLENSNGDAERPPPPLPSLKCGDETASGSDEPLVDEIACALREWSSLMYTYLARRDYGLFNAVREHTDLLHVARRQLLAQTLSAEEVSKLRRECVARLVKGNVLQGLDVIVRHPGRGGLVDVDFTGKDSDPESWVSGIRLFALQASLAYVDQQGNASTSAGVANSTQSNGLEVAASTAFGISAPSTSTAGVLGASSSFAGGSGSRSAKHSSIAPAPHARSSATNGGPSSGRDPPTRGVKYFHVYLDVKAFVASPCVPGETCELYLSLYNKAESRFLTEEYCVVLNHQGVPARESEGRLGKMRTLFTDLSATDMQELNVVCRIVRNGAMRITAVDSIRSAQSSGLLPADVLSGDLTDAGSIDGDLPPGGVPGMRPNRMASTRTFRRPFGCAVLELGDHHKFQTDIATSSPMREHVMPIFVPLNEAAFSTLHQDIIASRIREFEKSPRAELLAVNIKVLHGEATNLVHENPSLLQDAPLTARLGFPDVVFPGDRRNEAYIKLWSGEFFPAGTKVPGGGAQKNIQVSAEIRLRDGSVLERAISRGAGERLVTQFDSTVFYHQNAPTWGELFKLELPNEQMENCHIFFSFRHRSSKEERAGGGASRDVAGSGGAVSGLGTVAQALNAPFAHGYLPLFENSSAFIPDGSHTLLLWRSSRPAQHLSPELYFSLPPTISTAQNPSDVVPSSLASIIQPLRDSMTLRTFLVSTRFTQNEVLLKLLNWERSLSQDLQELKGVLVKFTFVGEVEIVKFLRDIFDALFAIVVSPKNGSGELDDLVFNALVFVLGIVQDRRFNNFRATLDVYIEKHFHSQTAYTRLMASMSRLLADPSRTETSKDLRAAIKVWPYLFKFIITSRQKQGDTTSDGAIGPLGGAVDDHFEVSFKKDLETLLRSVNRLMSSTKPASIVGTQTLALQHFAGILADLSKVFPNDELVRIETAFVDSIFITKGRMMVWKLLHILHVTCTKIFDESESRAQLIPSIIRWVRPHLGHYDEGAHTNTGDHESARDAARIAWMEGARLSVTIIGVVLDRLQNSIVEQRKAGPAGARAMRQEQDNVDYILSTMPLLLQTYKVFSSPETVKTLLRHRSPSTIASAVPVMFPSSYPFPLIAKRPAGFADGAPPRSARRRLVTHHHNFLNCGLGEIAAVLVVLVMLSPRRHLAGFLDEQLDLEGPEKLAEFLCNFFDVATGILLNEAYPSTWLNINILVHQMVLKIADPLAALLVRDFIPPADESQKFNTTLWRSALDMLLTLLSSDQLVIEQFKPQRRRAVWRLAGDIRGEGAQIFAKLWNSIGWPDKPDKPVDGRDTDGNDAGRLNTGGFQVQFVPSLVEPVLELCLSHHDELRTCAVRVLATMITSEWHLNGDFSVIEAEIIDKLDVLFITDTQGDEISRAFFIGQLRSLFESPLVDAKLREQVLACLVSVNRFLDLLLNVRSLPPEEGFEDDRVAGTLKLLGFLRQANRVTAFSTHVLRLVNLHLENRNYVEAALTLKLHADLHSWDMDNFVEPIPDLDLPRQSHFARKETLYTLILDYLGKGSAWEISIDICRELLHQYEYRSVDYGRLADVLRLQASLFEKIATVERTFPSYFRVAYYGQSWPNSLQDKMFVYRGLDWEKFGAFCERLHQKHPRATLIKSTSLPDESIRHGEEMYLQVTALQPEADKLKDIFTNAEVPPVVRAYFEHNATDLFSFARPIRKSSEGTRKPVTAGTQSAEPQNLWVEKTYLRCEDHFPTVLRRSHVAGLWTVELSPLQNAIDDAEAKTSELESLEKKYAALNRVVSGRNQAAARGANTNRLSMALNGAVDAPVNGGIPMYRKAFFSPQFVSANSDKEPLIHKLREAIDKQAVVIHRCIKLHARMCPPEMRPFHDTLERFFKQNFADEITRLELEVGTTEEEVSRSSSGHQTSVDSGRSNQITTLSTSGNAGLLLEQNPSHAYALDANSRLQRTPYGSDHLPAQSPLQKHITSLSKQVRPIKSSLGQLDGETLDEGLPIASPEPGVGSPVPYALSPNGASDGATMRGATHTIPASAISRYEASILTNNRGTSTKQGTSLFSRVEGGASRLSKLMSRNSTKR